MPDIRHYLTPEGRDVFRDWYDKLRDTKARIAIDRRINRIELGNFGDHKFVRDGVWELRLDVGPGYRIYYGKSGNEIILLLLGGDKKSQTTDINRASILWVDWQERLSHDLESDDLEDIDKQPPRQKPRRFHG